MLSSVGMVKAQQNPSHLKLGKNEAWILLFWTLTNTKEFLPVHHIIKGETTIKASGVPLHHTLHWTCATRTKTPHPQSLPSPDSSLISTQTPDSPTHTTAGSSAFSSIILQLFDA